MKRDLSPKQENALLMKGLSDEFGNHVWSTIRVLFKKGYIGETPDRKFIVLTKKGKDYLDEYHQDIRLMYFPGRERGSRGMRVLRNNR